MIVLSGLKRKENTNLTTDLTTQFSLGGGGSLKIGRTLSGPSEAVGILRSPNPDHFSGTKGKDTIVEPRLREQTF